jgi:16S rRNA (guanine527-N7)-methyltransferase
VPDLDLPPPDIRRRTLAAVLGTAPDAIPDATLDRLTALVEVMASWTRRINLVGPATVPEAWTRHVLDSAALRPLIPPHARRLADLGSGAGFPGLVLAILGAPDVHLVESDQRKATFLREAARATGTPVTVHARRIEALDPLRADVVSARALAPLPELLPLVVRHLEPDGVALLPKGRTAEDELTACADQWIMRVDRCPVAGPSTVSRPSASPAAARPGIGSGTADRAGPGGGTILILREIRRVASGT